MKIHKIPALPVHLSDVTVQDSKDIENRISKFVSMMKDIASGIAVIVMPKITSSMPVDEDQVPPLPIESKLKTASMFSSTGINRDTCMTAIASAKSAINELLRDIRFSHQIPLVTLKEWVRGINHGTDSVRLAMGACITEVSTKEHKEEDEIQLRNAQELVTEYHTLLIRFNALAKEYNKLDHNTKFPEPAVNEDVTAAWL